MDSRRGRFRIGTSGYQYLHWRGTFYPPALPISAFFDHYAAHFDSVEINNTFYGLPSQNVFDRWRAEAPPGFCYALKFSRFGTHLKHLADPESSQATFLERARRLGPRLGPILVQLPPNWKPNPERLETFLRAAPRRHRWAVEFRDPRWLCREVFDVLHRCHAALVIHDLIDDHPIELTCDWSYLRFHGQRSTGSYAHQALTAQARRIRRWLSEGRDVYAYFNNDREGHAPRDAARLRRYVEGVGRAH